MAQGVWPKKEVWSHDNLSPVVLYQALVRAVMEQQGISHHPPGPFSWGLHQI